MSTPQKIRDGLELICTQLEAYAGTIERYMGPGEAMGGTTHGVGWGRRNYHPGQKAGEGAFWGFLEKQTFSSLLGANDIS